MRRVNIEYVHTFILHIYYIHIDRLVRSSLATSGARYAATHGRNNRLRRGNNVTSVQWRAVVSWPEEHQARAHRPTGPER